MPRRIVLLGGGFIAAEFAHIAARAGAHVTVIEQLDRMLTPFDPDLVAWLMEKFRAIGIDVRLQTRVTAIERRADGLSVRAISNGKDQVFEVDLVVHAAGRVPNLDLLDLAAAGVASENGRLKLNEFLQSVSNPAVYAVGDAAMSGPPLTPVSSHDAKVAAANMLNGNHQKPNYLGVPSVAFTIPPIASVGLSEKQARANAIKLRMIGPHVDEVINIFALAIRNGLTAEDLKTTLFAYPTGASDLSSMV